MFELFRTPGPLRRFMFAHGQSSIGTSAGYVALLLIAYDRLPSAWAVSLVLLADFLPSVVLGPLFGALADRRSRRELMVIADILRAGAFIGIAVVGSFELTFVLALVAGVGTALYHPTSKSSLPALAGEKQLGVAVGAWSALREVGLLAGPAVAALAFVIAGPELAAALNGASFAIAALVVATLPLDRAPRTDNAHEEGGLWAHARDGIRATAGLPGVRTVLVASVTGVLAGALMNVGEPLLATESLDASDVAFAALIAAFGLGSVVTAVWSARHETTARYRTRYLAGFITLVVGLVASAIAPNVAFAAVAFVVSGVGTTLILVHEDQLLQRVLSDDLRGRVFGLKDALDSAAFVTAFLVTGAIIEATSPRFLFAVAAVAVAVAGVLAARGLAGLWDEEAAPAGE